MKYLRPTFIILAFMTLIVGGIYPAISWIIGQSIFSNKANGSLLYSHENKIIGSKLLAQDFTKNKFFWSRPPTNNSHISGFLVSKARDLNPSNPKLIKLIENRIKYIEENHSKNKETIPSDFALASASGLDPHISPESAFYQARRIATARNIPISTIKNLIKKHIEGKTLGFIGERKVNVLMLNLDLEIISRGQYGK